jgi:hypothetical protein
LLQELEGIVLLNSPIAQYVDVFAENRIGSTILVNSLKIMWRLERDDVSN